MSVTSSPGGGLRERKRRDTRKRIAQAGFELFVARGYEVATLEEIAAASGISRRTVFHYFKSKEDILLAWQSALVEALRIGVWKEGTKQPPLPAVCAVLRELAAGFDPEYALTMARLLKASERLRAANQAKYLKMEQAAFESLCLRWPQPDRRNIHRMVAMIALGAFRIALDSWTESGGKESVLHYVDQGFRSLLATLKDGAASAM